MYLDAGRNATGADWIGGARHGGVEVEGGGDGFEADAAIGVVPRVGGDAAIGVPDLQAGQQGAVPVEFDAGTFVEVEGAQRAGDAA